MKPVDYLSAWIPRSFRAYTERIAIADKRRLAVGLVLLTFLSVGTVQFAAANGNTSGNAKDSETMATSYSSSNVQETALGLSATLTPTLHGWTSTLSAVEIKFHLDVTNNGATTLIEIRMYRTQSTPPSQGSTGPFSGSFIPVYHRLILACTPTACSDSIDGQYMDIPTTGQTWTYYLTISQPALSGTNSISINSGSRWSLLWALDLA